MVYGELPLMLDHINRIKDDNRIENLRPCTFSQNSINKDIQKNNTSGVVGVRWHKFNKKWFSTISVNGKEKHLGYFKDKQDAIKVRLEAEKIHYGEYAPND